MEGTVAIEYERCVTERLRCGNRSTYGRGVSLKYFKVRASTSNYADRISFRIIASTGLGVNAKIPADDVGAVEKDLNWLSAVHDQGFAIIPGVLTPEDLEPVIAELSDPYTQRSRAGVRHAMRVPCVSALARDNRLLGMARKVLGDTALSFKATVFDKSSTTNWLVVWHQDTALPLKHRRDIPDWGPWSVKEGVTYAHAPADALNKVLTLRVHLDDSSAANGPLRVLPGTHVYGVLTDEAIHDFSTHIESTECCVARGGVLAMRPLIIHASSKSQTQSARRVLHIEYAETASIADRLELALA